MASMTALVRRHPVSTFYVLTFAISWGGFLLVGGRGFLSGTDWQADPRFLDAALVMITGPTVASLLLAGLVDGRAGLRELLSRLLHWRVGARWYAVALLAALLLAAAVPLALSLASPAFLPAIVTTNDRAHGVPRKVQPTRRGYVGGGCDYTGGRGRGGGGEPKATQPHGLCRRCAPCLLVGLLPQTRC